MPKLTIIVGMAGSGKSHHCDELAQDSKYPNNIFKDATLTSDDKKRAGHKCLGEIVARLLGEEDCIMDESHLVDKRFRDSFEDFCEEFLPDVKQKWIYYKKDALRCINNVYNDAKNGRRELERFKALNNQLEAYEPPEGMILKEVFECKNPEFKDEQKAICWLRSEIVKLQPN